VSVAIGDLLSCPAASRRFLAQIRHLPRPGGKETVDPSSRGGGPRKTVNPLRPGRGVWQAAPARTTNASGYAQGARRWPPSPGTPAHGERLRRPRPACCHRSHGAIKPGRQRRRRRRRQPRAQARVGRDGSTPAQPTADRNRVRSAFPLPCTGDQPSTR